MFFGVMAGSLSLVRSFLWPMFMLPAMMEQSKGCGIQFLLGCRRWVGVGCASAATSMLLSTWMNVALPGLDINLWTTFPSTGSLTITTWWIFP
jgi:hypothetical protein